MTRIWHFVLALIGAAVLAEPTGTHHAKRWEL